MKPTFIEARDLPDAWFLALYGLFGKGDALPDGVREYRVERGSYAESRRREYEFAIIHIRHPETRPLIPDIPPGMGLPPPTDMEYVCNYPEKLCSKHSRAENEDYTYGEYLEDQIAEVVRIYREEGFGTNQACMAVCDPQAIYLEDPPCLRQIDTRIYPEERKLHFTVIFPLLGPLGRLPGQLGRHPAPQGIQGIRDRCPARRNPGPLQGPSSLRVRLERGQAAPRERLLSATGAWQRLMLWLMWCAAVETGDGSGWNAGT